MRSQRSLRRACPAAILRWRLPFRIARADGDRKPRAREPLRDAATLLSRAAENADRRVGHRAILRSALAWCSLDDPEVQLLKVSFGVLRQFHAVCHASGEAG